MSWFPPGPALLFCPADHPDRFLKAALAADAVILDLEDGVAPINKPAARVALRNSKLDPTRTVVRINPVGTTDHELDLECLTTTPYDTVMLAKSESADQMAGLSHLKVIALCETPRGVLSAASIAACGSIKGLMVGAEDLVATLGGRSSRLGRGQLSDVARHSRSQVLLAGAVHGKPTIDVAHLNIDELEGLAIEARDGAMSGFSAKACIHPKQVAIVRRAYQPSDHDVEWARRVLAANTVSTGVFVWEGQMVDAPVLRQARRIIAASTEA
jgi:citrate lyase subunit beta/citryl-CoA lyase